METIVRRHSHPSKRNEEGGGSDCRGGFISVCDGAVSVVAGCGPRQPRPPRLVPLRSGRG